MIHHHPQSFGDFDHGSQPATAGRNQVNLLLLLLPQERGDYLASTLETRYRTPRETHRSLAKLEEAQVVPLLSTLTHLHVNPKGRQAYSLLQTTMEPLSHGL